LGYYSTITKNNIKLSKLHILNDLRSDTPLKLIYKEIYTVH